MQKKPRIFIVDDHALFREGIKLLIEQEDIGQIVGEAENGLIFLDMVKEAKPDLVLMDIQMPEMDGLTATREALDKWPRLKILALSMYADKENYSSMIEAGAMGFVLKTAGKQEFENAIKTTARGDNYFSSELLRQMIVNLEKDMANPDKNQKSVFSENELKVLKGFCSGQTMQEIADNLSVDCEIVENHKTSLLQKTQTRNIVNLVIFAIKNKLVSI
jgi:DNA-binding NarL/FixJ family response regulator